MRVIDLGITESVTGAVPFALAFSPDGRRIVVQNPSHGLAVLDPSAGIAVAVRKSGYGLFGGGFLADGRVLWAENRRIHAWHPDSGESSVISGQGYWCSAAVAADGRFAWAQRDSDEGLGPWRWDSETRAWTRALESRKCHLDGLAVSRDGRWLAGFDSGKVRVWRIRKDKPAKSAVFNAQTDVLRRPRSVALSPDGAWLAATANNGPATVWDVAAKKEACAPLLGTKRVKAAAFHPSRPLLALVGDDGAAAILDVATGSELARWSWPLDALHAVAFDPEGMRCAAASFAQCIVWDVDA